MHVKLSQTKRQLFKRKQLLATNIDQGVFCPLTQPTRSYIIA